MRVVRTGLPGFCAERALRIVKLTLQTVTFLVTSAVFCFLWTTELLTDDRHDVSVGRNRSPDPAGEVFIIHVAVDPVVLGRAATLVVTWGGGLDAECQTEFFIDNF